MITVGDYFKIDDMENCSSLSTKTTMGRLYLCESIAPSKFPCDDKDVYVYFTNDFGGTSSHYANMFVKVDNDILDTIAPANPKRVLYDVCDVYTAPTGAVTSNGGASSYYELEVAGNKIETHDIITDVFDNDFDMGNMFKAQVRIQAAINGSGKAGTSIEYDLNKIIYTCNKLKDKHVKTS